MGTVIPLKAKRRGRKKGWPAEQAGAENQALVMRFPDKLGLEAPAFDPSNPSHAEVWQAIWETGVLYKQARAAPNGHPLRAWYEREFLRSFPSASAIHPNV